MPAFVIFLAAAAFALAVFVFGHAKIDSIYPGAFWVVDPHRFQSAIEDRTWIMLLIFALLFILYAALVIRRASTNVWFFALTASSFPLLAALIPLAHFVRAVKNALNPNVAAMDAGGDWLFWISSAQRVYMLSLVLCVILGVLATYGFFARRKT